jgi:lambda family phage portal protein
MSLIYDIKASFYEGGKISKVNADFTNAVGTFEDTATFDRMEMIKRARWLHENNPIISNIDETLKNNVIGNGIKLKSLVTDKRIADEIELKYRARMESPDAYSLNGRLSGISAERTIFGARMMDGESIVNYVLTKDRNSPLKTQILEASNFDTSKVGDYIYSGVEVNKDTGKTKKLHFVDEFYNEFSLDAKNTLHIMNIENRASQVRGVSEYKQVILDLKNFMAYNTALIQNARVRANLPYYVTADNPTGAARGNSTSSEPNQQLQMINGLMVHYLNKGEDLKQLDPKVAGDNHKDFLMMVIRLIASGRKLSYELAFRDYSQVNFASSRASLIQDNKRFDYEQLQHIITFKNPDFEKWLEAMVLSGNMQTITPAQYYANKSEYLKKSWIPPAREWVDPLKDISAIKEKLYLGMTTLTREVGKQGLDIEDIIKEKQQEKKLFEDAGLEYIDTDSSLSADLLNVIKEENNDK